MSLKTYFDVLWLEIIKYNIVPFILILLGIYIVRKAFAQKLRLPPGPIGLPIVGYLPFIGKEPFITFDNLSKKYGNVFSLYLGRNFVVVLGDSTTAKEALSKGPLLYRPPKAFDFVPDGGGLVGENGEAWSEQRRFTVRTMKDLGLGKSKWVSLVEDEVADFLEHVESKKGSPVDINIPLMESVSNNISSLVFGKRLPPGAEMKTLISSINTITRFFSQSGLYAFFPALCDLLVKLKITKYYRIFQEMLFLNNFIRKEVDFRRSSPHDSKTVDFINDYLAEMENQKSDSTFTERNLIGNTQALYVAGSDTSKTSTMWLFLAMATFPDIQEKVHAELESILGTQRKAAWEDHMKFPYTYAVISESLRWRTVAPISVARWASEDVTLGGYDIPKGTTIFTNLWGLHHDRRYWKNPKEFIPERFLQNDGKEVNLRLESYYPFSFGKRKCPGEIVALTEIFLYFTAIIQKYKVQTPHGGRPNLEGTFGGTYASMPQKLCFIPREGK